MFPSSVAARRKNSRQNVTARGVETTAHSAMMAARRSSRSSASRAMTARGTAPSSDSSSESDAPSSSARRGRHRGHPQFIACVADARTCARGHASPLAHRPRRKKAHGVEESSPSRVRRRFDVDAGDADARRADPASASSSSSRDTGVPTSSRSRTRVDIGWDARRRVRAVGTAGTNSVVTRSRRASAMSAMYVFLCLCDFHPHLTRGGGGATNATFRVVARHERGVERALSTRIHGGEGERGDGDEHLERALSRLHGRVVG